MGRRWGSAFHGTGIPARVQRQLLRMPDIDGYWVGISPRQGLRRAQIIAVDRRRQEAERVAIERELHPGAYALFQAAHRGVPAGEWPDGPVEHYKYTSWQRWG
jgi:hypothetical protein